MPPRLQCYNTALNVLQSVELIEMTDGDENDMSTTDYDDWGITVARIQSQYRLMTIGPLVVSVATAVLLLMKQQPSRGYP